VTVTDQLRAAIEAETKRRTMYQVAKDSGVNWAVLNRFVTGERPTLRSDTMDRLCGYLGLELRRKGRRKKR
jgi:DNA-binding Xre family transcriptional regulator